MDRSERKTLPHLGNRVSDSLIRRDVSGGSDGAPLSPGVGHNLKTERQERKRECGCLITQQLAVKDYNGCQVKGLISSMSMI